MSLLEKDITHDDFVKFFGMNYDAYVEPVRLEYAEAVKTLGKTPTRNDLLRHRFNALARDEHELLNPRGVREFYCSDFYSRILAYEVCPNEATMNGLLSHIAEQMTEGKRGEAIEDAMKLAEDRFGAERLHILEHGFGTCKSVMWFLANGKTPVIDAIDYVLPIRSFMAQMVHKYTYDLGWVNFRWLYPDGRRPEFPLHDDTHYFSLIDSEEVIEHAVNPRGEVHRFGELARDGCILNMSTFFNSCNGDDPQHLLENEKFQDTHLWFDAVYDAGFAATGRDPRGCIKILEKRDGHSIHFDEDGYNGKYTNDGELK